MARTAGQRASTLRRREGKVANFRVVPAMTNAPVTDSPARPSPSNGATADFPM